MTIFELIIFAAGVALAINFALIGYSHWGWLGIIGGYSNSH